MHTKDKGIKGEGMITRNNKLFIILAVSVLICVVTAFGTRRYIYIYIYIYAAFCGNIILAYFSDVLFLFFSEAMKIRTC